MCHLAKFLYMYFAEFQRYGYVVRHIFTSRKFQQT